MEPTRRPRLRAAPFVAATLLTGAVHLRAQANWLIDDSLTTRTGSAAAHDVARGRTVLFGGQDGQRRADTWLWDGLQWQQRSSPNTPPPRSHHAMTYDSTRQRVVMYGGQTEPLLLADTWAWDGSEWSPIPTAHAPGEQVDHAMVYDAARDRVMLLAPTSGSAYVPVWEFDGTDWSAPPIRPPAWPLIQGGPLAYYDAVAARTVVIQRGGSEWTYWSWNGSVWTAIVGPAPRVSQQFKVVYDSLQQRPMLVAGIDPPDVTAAVHVWQPGSRTWQPVGTGAPQTAGHVAVFDPARNRVVLVSAVHPGALAESAIWEWDGSQWTRRTSGLPIARQQHQMVHDSHLDRVVLYGGSTSGLGDLTETWVREQDIWRVLVPPATPGSSSHPGLQRQHRLVYDAARQEVLMAGGPDQGLQRLWRLAGTQWTAIDPPSGPPARLDTALAFDARRQLVVMFGGNAHATSLADLWTWNGATWSQLQPALSPPPRYGHGMVYAPELDHLVMVGGTVLSGNLNDTWEFADGNWHLRFPSSPLPEARTQMGYDTARQAVTALLLRNNSALFDVWRWDGQSWHPVPTATPLTARLEAGLVSDPQGLLVFGGRFGANVQPAAMANLRTPLRAALTPFGPGGSTSAGPLLLEGDGRLPWLGDRFGVRLRPMPTIALPFLWLSLSRDSWQGQPLPLDLAPAGYPGTVVLVSPDGPWPIANDFRGQANAVIDVPPAPSLVGTTLFLQALAYEPTPGSLTSSNALTITLAAR